MLRDLLTAAVVLGVAAGCSGSSARRDGGAVNCYLRPDAGTNCRCNSAGTNSLSECSAASAAAADHGYCCSGGESCTCFRTACVNVVGIGHCECGDPYYDSSPRVDSCPQPDGGVCCLDPGLHPSVCWCNTNEATCPLGRTTVASCSLADVMNCGADETVVDRCK